jgi:hypothetical protein
MSEISQALAVVRRLEAEGKNLQREALGLPGAKEIRFDDGSIVEWDWGGWVVSRNTVQAEKERIAGIAAEALENLERKMNPPSGDAPELGG